MTENEASTILKAEIVHHPEYSIFAEALGLAIQALEKQIPKKHGTGGQAMRLIDADKLLELIKEQKEREIGAYAKGVNAGLNIVKSIINDETQTPTAFDVDKVINQMEKDKFIDCETILSDVHQGYNAGLSKAIDTVKRGAKE